MPEVAEVARQAEWLQKYRGKTVTGLEWDEKSKFARKPISGYNLIRFPLTIKNIFSRGKIIVLVLNENLYIVNHLGMTGYWTTTPTTHSNLWLTVDGEKLYFTDQRHFGNVSVTKDLFDCWKKNGPCLLTSALVRYRKVEREQLNSDQKIITRSEWHKAFQMTQRRNKTKICDFLLEQKSFSGIGNYLRCEILYKSAIHPEQTVITLIKEQINKLYEMTMETVYLSYKYNGPADGYLSGGRLPLAVYNRETDPYGNRVDKYVSKSRTVHYCPKIQII